VSGRFDPPASYCPISAFHEQFHTPGLLFSRVKDTNVARLPSVVQLGLLEPQTTKNKFMSEMELGVDASAESLQTQVSERTHFPDGRMVTPLKIAAARAAALSFIPPLAAFTAAMVAAAF
jgi:hypothetical protein